MASIWLLIFDPYRPLRMCLLTSLATGQPAGTCSPPVEEISYPSYSLGLGLCPSWTSEVNLIISTILVFFFLVYCWVYWSFCVPLSTLASTLALVLLQTLNFRHIMHLAIGSGYPTHSLWYFEEPLSLSTKLSVLDCCFTAVYIHGRLGPYTTTSWFQTPSALPPKGLRLWFTQWRGIRNCNFRVKKINLIEAIKYDKATKKLG